jgi:hypothetical protein
LAGVAAVLAAAVLGLTAAKDFECSLENTGCAHSNAKNGYYAGVLDNPFTRRPVANRRLGVYVASRDDYAVHINTDSRGRYCIIWAFESIAPDARLPRRHVSFGPHSIDVALLSHLGWQPLDGRPPPRGCQTSNVGVPWDRYDGLIGNSVGLLLALLSLSALGFLLASRIEFKTVRTRQIIASIGVLTSLAAACLALSLI